MKGDAHEDSCNPDHQDPNALAGAARIEINGLEGGRPKTGAAKVCPEKQKI